MNKVLKLTAITVFSTFALLGLSACHRSPVGPEIIQYQPLPAEEQNLIADIRGQGVQVIRLGDRLTLIIPTDAFFRPQTTELKRYKRYTVRQIARLVASYAARYPYATIRVYGYTDEVFLPGEREKLSREYAQVIASYIWQRGIPENRIQVKGMGARYPIASNRYPAGTAYNRRVVVEIN